MGFPRLSLYVVIYLFYHFLSKMCKIDIKRTLDATFLDCLALTFYIVIGDYFRNEIVSPSRVGQHFSLRQMQIFLSQG